MTKLFCILAAIVSFSAFAGQAENTTASQDAAPVAAENTTNAADEAAE